MSATTDLRGRSLRLALLAAVLLSCGPSGVGDVPLPSPSSGPGETVLPFTFVSKEGPIARPPQVFAAITLPDLQSQVAAANPSACKFDAVFFCWTSANPASGTLLIAIYIPTGCTQGQLASVVLKSGRVLMLQVNLRNVSCPPGAGTQRAPTLSMISVPLDRLSTGLLTVQANYAGDRVIGGPPSLDARTTVQIG